jgi:hypothetical protein
VFGFVGLSLFCVLTLGLEFMVCLNIVDKNVGKACRDIRKKMRELKGFSLTFLFFFLSLCRAERVLLGCRKTENDVVLNYSIYAAV